MTIDHVSGEDLKRGAQDLSAIGLAVMRPDGLEVVVLECAEIVVTAGRARVARADLQAAQPAVRAIRRAVRDCLAGACDRDELSTLALSLRSILESVLRRSLPFRNEKAEQTSMPSTTVTQTVKEVHGKLAGMRTSWSAVVAADIRQHVDVVRAGGEVVGLELRDL